MGDSHRETYLAEPGQESPLFGPCDACLFMMEWV